MRPSLHEVLSFIYTRELREQRTTGIDVANHFPVESKTYGRQQATSTVIAEARRRKLLKDVKRCDKCGCALTRGNRNVTLKLTKQGRNFVNWDML